MIEVVLPNKAKFTVEANSGIISRDGFKNSCVGEPALDLTVMLTEGEAVQLRSADNPLQFEWTGYVDYEVKLMNVTLMEKSWDPFAGLEEEFLRGYAEKDDAGEPTKPVEVVTPATASFRVAVDGWTPIIVEATSQEGAILMAEAILWGLPVSDGIITKLDNDGSVARSLAEGQTATRL